MTSPKEKERRADDRLALMAVILGGTIAFLSRRDPMALGTGLSLGLSGAILALRGERSINARGWLRAALLVALICVVARLGLEMYQEWVVAQWFAEGHSGTATNYELSRISELASGLRVAGLGFSLAMLLGAAVNRMS